MLLPPLNELKEELKDVDEKLSKLLTFIQKRIKPEQMDSAKKFYEKFKQRKIYLHHAINVHDFLC